MVYFMSVKLGLSQWMKNSEWKSWRMGCWARNLVPSWRKLREAAKNVIRNSLTNFTLTKHYSGGQIDDDERGCGAVRDRRYTHRYMAGNNGGKRKLGRARRSWKNTIMCIKTSMEWTGLIWLRIGTNGLLLSTQPWTFRLSQNESNFWTYA